MGIKENPGRYDSIVWKIKDDPPLPLPGGELEGVKKHNSEMIGCY